MCRLVLWHNDWLMLNMKALKILAACVLLYACSDMDTHTWESDTNGPPAQMATPVRCDHDTATKWDKDVTCPACKDKYPVETQ